MVMACVVCNNNQYIAVNNRKIHHSEPQKAIPLPLNNEAKANSVMTKTRDNFKK